MNFSVNNPEKTQKGLENWLVISHDLYLQIKQR